MLKLRVLDLLKEQGKTKYRLYMQVGNELSEFQQHGEQSHKIHSMSKYRKFMSLIELHTQ